MTYVTIDFSLNSPGICIYHNSKYTFFSYLKPKSGTKKEQALQEDISHLSDVILIEQPDFKNNFDFSSAELAKIHRYIQTSNDIIKEIKNITLDATDYIFAFEGTSYGSKMSTNNMIDMAAGAAILKMRIIEEFNPETIETISPSTIKKFINKGNMSKLDIWPFFIEDSKHLPFGKFCKDNIGLNIKKIPKPFDDLVDAFYLLNLVKSMHTKGEL